MRSFVEASWSRGLAFASYANSDVEAAVRISVSPLNSFSSFRINPSNWINSYERGCKRNIFELTMEAKAGAAKQKRGGPAGERGKWT